MYDAVNTKFKSIQNCNLCFIGKFNSYIKFFINITKISITFCVYFFFQPKVTANNMNEGRSKLKDLPPRKAWNALLKMNCILSFSAGDP